MRLERTYGQGRLSPAGERALASFLAGRLPAGRLHAELCRVPASAPTPPRVTAAAPSRSASAHQ